MRYYIPPIAALRMYNFGYTTTDSITANWFNWKNNQLPSRLRDPQIQVMVLFVPILAIFNTVYIFSALTFLYFSRLKQCSPTNKHILSIMLMVWLGNLIFSVAAAPTELRYQIFPFVITLPFCLLLISWLIQASESESAASLI